MGFKYNVNKIIIKLIINNILHFKIVVEYTIKNNIIFINFNVFKYFQKRKYGEILNN